MSWQPSASIEALRFRAQKLSQLRKFFNQNGYLEVETPILASHGVSSLYLTNIQVRVQRQTYFLQTSPEYHMKRLLAAHRCPIYQLSKVFRDDELGRWHNPEFTMLEWYQLGFDHFDLMAEMDVLLREVFELEPMKKVTYQEVFMTYCEICPLTSSLESLHKTLHRFGLGRVLQADEKDRDQILYLLMSHVIEKALRDERMPVAIYHFPISQAALAEVNHGVAERFEVFYKGVELANGFHELTCPIRQRERFEKDNEARKKAGLLEVEIDEFLLSALHHGLPNCAGVALGIDRLLALAKGESSIEPMLSFNFSKA